MKKILSITFMLLFIFTYTAKADSISDEVKKVAEKNVQVISQQKGFSVWIGAKAESIEPLYNSQQNVSAYLVNIVKENQIVGYMLLNPNNKKVKEFALGQSPYNEYLSQYIELRNIEFKGKNIKKVYDGPSKYGIAVIDGSDPKKVNKVYDFTNDYNFKPNIDMLKGVKKIQSKPGNFESIQEKNTSMSIIPPIEEDPILKILNGVGMSDSDSKTGCGPAAGFNLIKYWDTKSIFQNLLTVTEDDQYVKPILYKMMGTDNIIIGDATYGSCYATGLRAYMSTKYKNTFITEQYLGDTFNYNTLKNEVNANRPGSLLYYKNKEYPWHYVDFMGYMYFINSKENYYVIHDGFTKADLYRNWDEDRSTITDFFTLKVISGLKNINGGWYYLDESGNAKTGWQYFSSSWHYFNTDGVMQKGQITLDGKSYFLDENGAMQKGWVYFSSSWHYFNTDGVMQKGLITLDGKSYFLDENGVMQKGWVYFSSNWHYFDENGVMQTGWIYLGSKWYHLDENGVMHKGWVYFNSSWYYFDESGVMQTGWEYLGSKWYYLNSDGKMRTEPLVENGKTYYFDVNGVCTNP